MCTTDSPGNIMSRHCVHVHCKGRVNLSIFTSSGAHIKYDILYVMIMQSVSSSRKRRDAVDTVTRALGIFAKRKKYSHTQTQSSFVLMYDVLAETYPTEIVSHGTPRV